MMKLHIAPCTKVTYDYGSELCRERGIIWLAESGHPMAGSFEAGKTVAELRAKLAEVAAKHGEQFELEVHPHVTRSFDINPHGLI